MPCSRLDVPPEYTFAEDMTAHRYGSLGNRSNPQKKKGQNSKFYCLKWIAKFLLPFRST
ncbi:hypothetical protein Mapa_014881 [Marchantia paleacea]|nr:hypothetical protein Mapa_014881 [Marchantia paleacea]